jgi:hypothetical protein
MDTGEGPRRPGQVFAPLVGRLLNGAELELVRVNGKRFEPALDASGQPIELNVDDEMADLVERIPTAGRYRVIAREPMSNDVITYADYQLEPQSVSRPRPQRQAHSPPPPPPKMAYMPPPEHGFIAHLHETINNQRDQIRDITTRADRDVRYERERADDRIRVMQDKCEVAVKQAHDAEVKAASVSARLDARTQRVGELEEQVAEMKAEIEQVRELAAELKLKAEESEFSPLDALMQMDQALDVIGKTAERFTKKK